MEISEVIADPVREGLLWWSETRSSEGGRTAVMCCRTEADCDLAGHTIEVTPADSDVRSLVHEYGGGAWWPHDGVLYYVDFADQRLRRLEPGGEPVALTPEPRSPSPALRYADGRITPDGRWCVCVREHHAVSGSEPVNELVAVACDGSGRVEPLWSQADFVSSPRISADGELLVWISWDHPNMPWDCTRLHVYGLGDGELGPEVLCIGSPGSSAAPPAGSTGRIPAPAPQRSGVVVAASLCEPGWGPAGLRVCSDHEDWWNLYDVDLVTGELAGVVTGAFDIATPPWVFGMQRWAASGSAGSERVVAVVAGAAGDELIVDGQRVGTGDSAISSLTAITGDGTGFAYAAAGWDHEAEVVTLQVTTSRQIRRRVVRPARELPFDAGFITEPEPISFATGSLDEAGPRSDGSFDYDDDDPGSKGSKARVRAGAEHLVDPFDDDPGSKSSIKEASRQPGPEDRPVAHALFYRPANPGYRGPADQRPPLLVLAHGGPTAAARRQLQPAILYWTSRGIAVVDVDYRGSTGYGRRYRRALDGAWGLADVADCVAAAWFLADRGDVDGERLIIRGSSAGGFTVLSALGFFDVFAAGASRYGIADLEALAGDTHKFESRYLDTLVGPYPEAAEVYRARSPIHHVERFSAPMIVLQGGRDPVVPPAQAEMIVEALLDRGIPVAYLLFDDERHGFRRAENIITALEAELAFFGRILGFEPADDLPELEIQGL